MSQNEINQAFIELHESTGRSIVGLRKAIAVLAESVGMDLSETKVAVQCICPAQVGTACPIHDYTP